ncbi:DUF4269 domain-containing protein [Algibacter sp. L1A34]|uniref:DUF4269 domain-containing protein n=1 Tax=Algibacter sp. L1A34 TaxID=2686365 RepID=UPI00131C304E|nr:DUF4269 domain-containing protein [Algibacter sp. L1A34]
MIENFSNKKDFKVYTIKQNGINPTLAGFKTGNLLFEVFSQNIPTEKQNTYRHIIIENKILKEKGYKFKQNVKHRK